MYSSGLKFSSFSFSRMLRSFMMPFCWIEGGRGVGVRSGEVQVGLPPRVPRRGVERAVRLAVDRDARTGMRVEGGARACMKSHPSSRLMTLRSFIMVDYRRRDAPARSWHRPVRDLRGRATTGDRRGAPSARTRETRRSHARSQPERNTARACVPRATCFARRRRRHVRAALTRSGAFCQAARAGGFPHAMFLQTKYTYDSITCC